MRRALHFWRRKKNYWLRDRFGCVIWVSFSGKNEEAESKQGLQRGQGVAWGYIRSYRNQRCSPYLQLAKNMPAPLYEPKDPTPAPPYNPPAFPQRLPEFWHKQESESGMTLWDYFAAAALSGLCATELPNDKCVQYASEIADAMLKVREAK